MGTATTARPLTPSRPGAHGFDTITGFSLAEKAAAFVDGGHTYRAHGDGVQGVQDSDILIVLTGVDDVAAIATSAGGYTLVIV